LIEKEVRTVSSIDELTQALFKGRVSRRGFIQGAMALGISMSGAAALLEACTSGTSSSSTDLTFVVWSYGVETIKDNIKKLEDKESGLHVNFQDFAWTNYHDTMVARFAGKTPTDICYGSDHWLSEWAAAGWLSPLGTKYPDLNSYTSDYFPYVIQGMTYQGKNYGIPYYADTWAFLYNEDHLKRAGISQPPSTWEELSQQSLQIKSKGIANYPVILLFAQDDPGSIEVWTSMVFSRTDGHLFDDSLNPVFNRPGSAAAKTIDWTAGALNTQKILDPASLTSQEIPVVKAMESGAHTFTILETYNQAELNKSGSGPFSGKFKMAPMPGDTHNTVGYVRFYSVTDQLTKRNATTVKYGDDFLQYFGGKPGGSISPVVKRWAVENGLGFGWKSLWDDADVRNAFSTWGNPDMLKQNQQLARSKEGLTKYYPTWDVFTRGQLQKAYLGQATTQSALSAMADKWNSLKQG
jgi:multiple sugar transport system substrate-binding protein